MRRLSTSEIIDGIKENDPHVLHYVYQSYFKKVEAFVVANSGSASDAADLFQETMIVIFQKVRNDDLNLRSSFKSFFFGVIRKLWLKHLEVNRRRQHQEKSYSGDMDVFQVTDDLYSAYDQAIIRQLILKYYNKLGAKCQQILELYAHKMPVKDIAEKLGCSESLVKKRKFECKEKLVRELMNDPLFKYLFNHE